MTADEYRVSLKELGLTQVALQERLGLNKSTTSRYAMGQLDVPLWLSVYLETEKKLQALSISA